MFFSKRDLYMNSCILIVAAFIFILLTAMQVFAQNTFINKLTLNPFILEIALFANMIGTLSSPFSIYTNDQYSSYDPFQPPYVTIPDSPGFYPLPFPYKIGGTTGLNFPYKTYEVYNPVSFLNSGYPDFSIMNLGIPSIEETIGLNLISPFFQYSFSGAVFPFVPPGLFPGFISNPFLL